MPRCQNFTQQTGMLTETPHCTIRSKGTRREHLQLLPCEWLGHRSARRSSRQPVGFDCCLKNLEKPTREVAMWAPTAWQNPRSNGRLQLLTDHLSWRLGLPLLASPLVAGFGRDPLVLCRASGKRGRSDASPCWASLACRRCLARTTWAAQSADHTYALATQTDAVQRPLDHRGYTVHGGQRTK